LSHNMFANPNACRPLTRTISGIGLALAAVGAIGLGCGVAGAAPQQPLLVDDPVPVPTPAGPNPTNAVNIANAIFGELDAVLNAVFPGSGSVFMPSDSGTNSLVPGTGYPGAVPGQTPGVPSYPGTVPPGYPSSVVPGQTPGQPGYPSAVPPGYPTSVAPAQAPGVPSSPSPLLPGQGAVPGSPPPVAPGLPFPSPSTLGQVSPQQAVPVV
jgi:hypothetical protein